MKRALSVVPTRSTDLNRVASDALSLIDAAAALLASPDADEDDREIGVAVLLRGQARLRQLRDEIEASEAVA